MEPSPVATLEVHFQLFGADAVSLQSQELSRILSAEGEASALEALEHQLGSLQPVADAIKRSKAYVSRRIRIYQDPLLAAAILDGGLARTTAQEFLHRHLQEAVGGDQVRRSGAVAETINLRASSVSMTPAPSVSRMWAKSARHWLLVRDDGEHLERRLRPPGWRKPAPAAGRPTSPTRSPYVIRFRPRRR